PVDARVIPPRRVKLRQRVDQYLVAGRRWRQRLGRGPVGRGHFFDQQVRRRGLGIIRGVVAVEDQRRGFHRRNNRPVEIDLTPEIRQLEEQAARDARLRALGPLQAQSGDRGGVRLLRVYLNRLDFALLDEPVARQHLGQPFGRDLLEI